MAGQVASWRGEELLIDLKEGPKWVFGKMASWNIRDGGEAARWRIERRGGRSKAASPLRWAQAVMRPGWSCGKGRGKAFGDLCFLDVTEHPLL